MDDNLNNEVNRRKFPRAAFPCKIIMESPIRLLVSHTENLSEGGIRVILEEKLNAFANVGMEMFLEKDRPIKCKGRVMWVMEKINPLDHKATLYDTGIQFTNINQADKDYISKLVNVIVSGLSGGGAAK